MFCVIGVCVSVVLPTTRLLRWNHVNENMTPGTDKKISCIPSALKTCSCSISWKVCLTFCERSLLWQPSRGFLNHQRLSISQSSQVRKTCMPSQSALTDAIDPYCLKLACVTIFHVFRRSHKTKQRWCPPGKTTSTSSSGQTQHLLAVPCKQSSLPLVSGGFWRSLLWEMKTGNIFHLP